MLIDEHIKYWLDNAEDDLLAAFDIYHAKRYNWALFIGHLALEKVLKALFIQSNNDSIPPKIHNLLKLIKLSNIDISQEQAEFLIDVNRFQLTCRYPDFKDDIYKIANQEFTYNYLIKIKEMFLWLKSLMK